LIQEEKEMNETDQNSSIEKQPTPKITLSPFLKESKSEIKPRRPSKAIHRLSTFKAEEEQKKIERKKTLKSNWDLVKRRIQIKTEVSNSPLTKLNSLNTISKEELQSPANEKMFFPCAEKITKKKQGNLTGGMARRNTIYNLSRTKTNDYLKNEKNERRGSENFLQKGQSLKVNEKKNENSPSAFGKCGKFEFLSKQDSNLSKNESLDFPMFWKNERKIDGGTLTEELSEKISIHSLTSSGNSIRTSFSKSKTQSQSQPKSSHPYLHSNSNQSSKLIVPLDLSICKQNSEDSIQIKPYNSPKNQLNSEF
jgi:hypothetical protein